MELQNKILILDNEDMVLETIEMFYPSDDVTLFTASSFQEGCNILQTEKPEVVVTNIDLQEINGGELIKSLKEKRSGVEVVVMSDLEKFKDTLAEYGSDISDVVYKPIDMDILEIIVKRAQRNYLINNDVLNTQQDATALKDENSNLNAKILELGSKMAELQQDNQELKDNIQQKEQMENSDDNPLHSRIKSLEAIANKEKKLKSDQLNFIIAIINAIRKASNKNSLNEILDIFMEAISKGLKIKEVKASVFEKNNQAKITKYTNAIEDKKLYLLNGNNIEIPLFVGEYFCLISIMENFEIDDYTYMFHFIKDVINLISSIGIIKLKQSQVLEKEKANSRSIKTILANIQMYIKKSQALEKITHTKEDLTRMSNEILDLVFDAQDELKNLNQYDKDKINLIQEKISIITDEKAQNFDFLAQKMSQIIELVQNIQSGLEGKRMKQVSGDQFLFSTDRNKV